MHIFATCTVFARAVPAVAGNYVLLMLKKGETMVAISDMQAFQQLFHLIHRFLPQLYNPLNAS